MKKILGLAVLAVLAAVVVYAVIGGLSYYSQFVKFENRIDAINKDMQNVHASIYNNIKSQGLAVEKYGEMVTKAIEVATTGRYGESGIKSAFAWIQEQNPQIDSSIMHKLQVVIEAGYNKFEATQRTKIDMVNKYKDVAMAPPGNIFAWVFSFPKKSWEELDKIVTTSETKKTFEKGEMETIDPFKK